MIDISPTSDRHPVKIGPTLDRHNSDILNWDWHSESRPMQNVDSTFYIDTELRRSNVWCWLNILYRSQLRKSESCRSNVGSTLTKCRTYVRHPTSDRHLVKIGPTLDRHDPGFVNWDWNSVSCRSNVSADTTYSQVIFCQQIFQQRDFSREIIFGDKADGEKSVAFLEVKNWRMRNWFSWEREKFVIPAWNPSKPWMLWDSRNSTNPKNY